MAIAGGDLEIQQTQMFPSLTRKIDRLYYLFDGNILLEDWLIKAPPVRFFRNDKWERRYFVLLELNENHYDQSSKSSYVDLKQSHKLNQLSKYCLAYWKTEEKRHMGEKPIRVIPLQNCKAEPHEHQFWKHQFPYMMRLHTQQKRTFFFCSESKDVHRLWLNSLQQVIESNTVSNAAGQLDGDEIYERINDLSPLRNATESWCSGWSDESGYNSRSNSTLNKTQNGEDIYENIDFNESNDLTNDLHVDVKSSQMLSRLCYSTPNIMDGSNHDKREKKLQNLGDIQNGQRNVTSPSSMTMYRQLNNFSFNAEIPPQLPIRTIPDPRANNNYNAYDIPSCQISTLKCLSIGSLKVQVPYKSTVKYEEDKIIIHTGSQEVIFQVREISK